MGECLGGYGVMGVYAGPDGVESGLVLALDAGNPKSYPGSGTTWTDLSGSGNNGTLVNGVGYSGDNLGSLVFDGVDDRVDISYSPSLTPAIGFSIEAFCTIQNNGGTWSSLIQYPFSNNSHTTPFFEWAIYLNKPNRQLHTRVDGEGASSSNNVWNFNEWTYIAITFENQSVKYYVNGSIVGSSSVTKTSIVYDANNRVIIGANASNTEPYQGNLGNIKLYNRALTASEIQQNFIATRSRFGI
jgi:hypothetical protein